MVMRLFFSYINFPDPHCLRYFESGQRASPSHSRRKDHLRMRDQAHPGATKHLRFVHVGVKNILAATVDVHSRLVHVQAGEVAVGDLRKSLH